MHKKKQATLTTVILKQFNVTNVVN